MIFYFDTNCVRRINSIDQSSQAAIVTSQLAVFETVSGITSEIEFAKRKKILSNLQNSSVKIIWESPKTYLEQALNVKVDYSDVLATKIFFSNINQYSNYQELLEDKFEVEGKIYSLRIMQEYDTELTKASVRLIKDQLSSNTEIRRSSNWPSIHEVDPSHIQVFSEMMMRQFILNNLPQGTNTDSDAYIIAAHNFSQNAKISDFVLGITLRAYQTATTGDQLGKNDIFDFGHLIYATQCDYFISDDSFFKRLPALFFGKKFLDWEGFMRGISNQGGTAHS